MKSYGEGQQLYIFKTINSISYSNEEKLEAIKAVTSKDPVRGLYRDEMWAVIKWLLYLREEEQRNE